MGTGREGVLGVLPFLAVHLLALSKLLSPCQPLTGIAAFSSELLLTSGITLHVRIFVKTAVQHKDKKSGIFSGRTCGFSCRRAPSSPGRLGCKLGGGSACGRGCPRELGLVICGYL